MAKYSIQIKSFDGGLNTKVDKYLGAANESPDTKDTQFDDYGAVQSRYGSSLLGVPFYDATGGDVTSGGGIDLQLDDIADFKPSTGSEILVCTGRSDIFGYNADDTSTLIWAPGWTYVQDKIQSFQFRDRLWYFDGSNNPRKYNPTDDLLTDHTSPVYWGSYPPTVTPVFDSTVATGNLDGTYTWVILHENGDGVYSNYSTATSEQVVENAQAKVFLPATTRSTHEDDIVKRWLCRNKTGTAGVYYLSTSTTTMTDTTVTDNVADGSLVTLAPTDNGLPPSDMLHAVAFQERIFCTSAAAPYRLYYSEIDDPEVFGGDSYLEVSRGDGFGITALTVVSNGIVIHKSDDRGNGVVYMLYMPDTTPANWSLVKTDSLHSSMSPETVKYLNSIAFVNRYGIYDMREDARGIVNSDSLSFNIDPSIKGLDYTGMYQARMINYDDKLWFAVPDSSANDSVYVYDYVRGRGDTARSSGAWTQLQYPWLIKKFQRFDGKLVALARDTDSTNCRIYRLRDTDTQLDVDDYDSTNHQVDAQYQTMVISGLPEHENNAKIWRWAYIHVRATGDYQLQVDYSKDIEGGNLYTAYISLSPAASYWGIANWGYSDWGPGVRTRKEKIILQNQTSKTIQFKISSYTSDMSWKIIGIEVFYNLRGVRNG